MGTIICKVIELSRDFVPELNQFITRYGPHKAEN